MSSFVRGESLGKAYMEALNTIMEGRLLYWYLVVHCDKPILADPATGRELDYRDIDGLGKVINLDEEVFRAFCGFLSNKVIENLPSSMGN